MKQEKGKAPIKSRWAEKAEYRIRNRKWLNYSSNIARRILASIEEKNEVAGDYNQGTLAAEIDVSRQYISKVVKGQENLSLETIAKLSEALGMELISFPEYKYSERNYQNCLTIAIDADEFKAGKGSTSSALEESANAVETYEADSEFVNLEKEALIA